jgi:hypothetical protein
MDARLLPQLPYYGLPVCFASLDAAAWEFPQEPERWIAHITNMKKQQAIASVEQGDSDGVAFDQGPFRGSFNHQLSARLALSSRRAARAVFD